VTVLKGNLFFPSTTPFEPLKIPEVINEDSNYYYSVSLSLKEKKIQKGDYNMSDVKPEDRILNCIPSQDVETDWGYTAALGAEILEKPKKIPPSVDLRAKWWDIGDQLDTGSCVGWASADAILRWHMVKAQKINENEKLSVRFQWMAAKESDEFPEPATCLESYGTSLKAALDIARNYGSIPDKEVPFEPEKLSHMSPYAFYALASKYKIANYFNLRKPGISWDKVKQRWKEWIATNGPIMTRLDVDATWDNAENTQGQLDKYKPDTSRGGHAISIVGYTDDRFIIRNSWGTAWGDNGFAYASMDYAKDAFTEAYGVTVV